MKNVSVLIMAGGKSERMCTPKPFLLIGGKTFIEKISGDYFRFGVRSIFVILNTHLVRSAPVKIKFLHVIANPHPEFGRFFSLQAGLEQIPGSNFVFIHNVDNPFVELDVLKKMWATKKVNGFVVPMHHGQGGHPVLISPNIVKHILSIQHSTCDLRDVLHHYDRIEIKSDSEKILTNINTWPEYEEQVLNLIPEYQSD